MQRKGKVTCNLGSTPNAGVGCSSYLFLGLIVNHNSKTEVGFKTQGSRWIGGENRTGTGLWLVYYTTDTDNGMKGLGKEKLEGPNTNARKEEEIKI